MATIMKFLALARAPALALVGVVSLGGCDANTPTYFQPMGALEVGIMGGADEATATVVLPFRAPTDKERSDLDAETSRLGFPVPWLQRKSIAISIQYSITNLSSKPGRVQILVDGGNEFTDYDSRAIAAAAQAAGNDEAEPLALVPVTPRIIEGGQTVSGVVREDDFAEAALDLDALGRWSAVPASVLVNPSDLNPVGLENVPAGIVLPALLKVTVTFSASEHMRMEFLVRVRDDRDQLASGDDPAFAPTPMALARTDRAATSPQSGSPAVPVPSPRGSGERVRERGKDFSSPSTPSRPGGSQSGTRADHERAGLALPRRQQVCTRALRRGGARHPRLPR
jgi:hypothetical protein